MYRKDKCRKTLLRACTTSITAANKAENLFAQEYGYDLKHQTFRFVPIRITLSTTLN